MSGQQPDVAPHDGGEGVETADSVGPSRPYSEERSVSAGGPIAYRVCRIRLGRSVPQLVAALVGIRIEGYPSGGAEKGWSVEHAERLLSSLNGVLSARMVADAGGEIEEIHVVTTHEVSPKQTVRNVESALLAQLGISVDHRKISVAQTSAAEPAAPEPEAARIGNGQSAQGTRIRFLGHELENERPYRLRVRVTIEWNGERFSGEAVGADLPRSRMDTVASAVLQGLESVIVEGAASAGAGDEAALALDGVKLVEAFDRQYVLVGVHAIRGREAKVLCGSSPVEDVVDRAVILATLQAADRWVRGRL